MDGFALSRSPGRAPKYEYAVSDLSPQQANKGRCAAGITKVFSELLRTEATGQDPGKEKQPAVSSHYGLHKNGQKKHVQRASPGGSPVTPRTEPVRIRANQNLPTGVSPKYGIGFLPVNVIRIAAAYV